MIYFETIFDSDREEYEFMQDKKDQPMKDQIKEMQTVINGALFEDFRNGNGVCIKTISEHLYNAGYRKQSDGEWIVDGDDKYRRAECSNCGHEYAVQKGMLQLHRFPYCPNCGAKMKGGAE